MEPIVPISKTQRDNVQFIQPQAMTPETPHDGPPPAAIELPQTPDRISELYYGQYATPEKIDIARNRVHWICANAQGNRVLDVGCSQGIISILLAREGFSVTALDVNPAAIHYLTQEINKEVPEVQGRIRPICGDLMTFADAPFDTIILGEIIEHQTHPERVIADAARLLAPEGVLVLTTPFGLKPFWDHKSTIFLSTLDAATRPRLTTESLDIVNGYICYVGSLKTNEAGKPQSLDPSELLKRSENAFLEIGRTYYADIEKKNQAIKNHSEKAARLREESQKLKADIANYKSQITALKQRELDLERAEMAYASEVTVLKAELKLRQEELSYSRAARQETLQALQGRQNDIQSLIASREALQVEATAVAEEHDRLTPDLAALQTQLYALTEELRLSDEQVAMLQTARNEQLIEKNRMSLLLQAQTAQLAEHQKALDAQTLETAQLQSALEETAKALEQMQLSHAAAQQEIGYLQGLHAEYESQIGSLRSNLADSLAVEKQQLAAQQELLARYEAQSAEHQQLLSDTQTASRQESDTHQQTISALQAASQQQSDAHHEQIRQHEAHQNYLLELLETAKQQAETHQGLIFQYEAQLAERQHEVGRVEWLLKEKTAYVDTLHDTLNRQLTELDELRQALESRTNELDVARDALAARDKQFNDMQQLWANRQSQWDDLNWYLGERDSQIAQLRIALADTQDTLADWQSQAERSAALYHELEAQTQQTLAEQREEVYAANLRMSELAQHALHHEQALNTQKHEAARLRQSLDAQNDQLYVANKEIVKLEQIGLQHEKALHEQALEVDRLQAKLTASETKLRQETVRLTDRIDQIKNTLSFQLGYALIWAFQSPKDAWALPGRLLDVRRQAVQRRKARQMQTKTSAAPTGLPLQRKTQVGWAPQQLDEIVAKAQAIYLNRGAADMKVHLSDVATRLDVANTTKAKLYGEIAKFLKEGDPTEAIVMGQRAFQYEQTYPRAKWLARVAHKHGHVRLAAAMVHEMHRSDKMEPHLENWCDLVIGNENFLNGKVMVPAKAGLYSGYTPRAGSVAYFQHYSLPHHTGGYAIRSHGLAKALARIDTDYRMVCFTRCGYPWDMDHGKFADASLGGDTVDGIHYWRIAGGDFSNQPFDQYLQHSVDAVERMLLQHKPAIVQAASSHVTALPALIAANRLGIPFVYEVRGLWEITRSSRQPDWKATERWEMMRQGETLVATAADRVVTLTEGLRQELIARGVSPHKIDLVPNGVDTEQFTAQPPNDALKAKLGITDETVIGFIGSFVDYEGLDDLVAAATILLERGERFKILMVGSGQVFPHLEKQVAEAGLSDIVILTGRVPFEAVPAYYSLIDIAAFPRKPWEVCEMVSPLKPFEAMAMGKVVLSSSVQALKDIIIDGETGLLFEKGNVTDLADKLSLLIEHAGLRNHLARNAKSWMENERTWEKSAEKLLSVYDALLAKNASPALV